MVSGSRKPNRCPASSPDHKAIVNQPLHPRTSRNSQERLSLSGAGRVGRRVPLPSTTSFGTEVTILEALPRVVPVEDEEIFLLNSEKSFKKKGLRVQTAAWWTE